jgi:hypothetical protein
MLRRLSLKNFVLTGFLLFCWGGVGPAFSQSANSAPPSGPDVFDSPSIPHSELDLMGGVNLPLNDGLGSYDSYGIGPQGMVRGLAQVRPNLELGATVGFQGLPYKTGENPVFNPGSQTVIELLASSKVKITLFGNSHFYSVGGLGIGLFAPDISNVSPYPLFQAGFGFEIPADKTMDFFLEADFNGLFTLAGLFGTQPFTALNYFPLNAGIAFQM